MISTLASLGFLALIAPLSNRSSRIVPEGDKMISTLALLGFLALVFLLAHRIVVACERHSHIRKQRQPWQREFASRKIEQEKPGSPPEQSDTLVPVRQV
jgi:hypothetical protein